MGNQPSNSSSEQDNWLQLLEFIKAPSSEEFRQKVIALSSDLKNFDVPDTVDFEVDSESDSFVSLATYLLELDPKLAHIRRKLVPGRMKEIRFWRNYIYRIAFMADRLLPRSILKLELALEKAVGIEAVTRACGVAQAAYKTLVTKEVITKKDKSPVTIADFSCQAIIINELQKHFPNDPIVAEEHSSDLNEETRQRVTTLVNSVQDQPLTYEQIKALIDKGNHSGGPGGRFWTIDPIDGTLGYLRGEQYAVCLGLIENGKVVLGILGCPNLPVQWPKGNTPTEDIERGVLACAVINQGATIRKLGNDQESTISVQTIQNSREANFCESVEASHSSHGQSAKIAELLGITVAPVRMDSQCKYVAIARGDASIYLRLSTGSYQEKIWDHAGGKLLVEEAGGRVTDTFGKPLDFTLGTKLSQNVGVIASNGQLHDVTLSAILETTETQLKVTVKSDEQLLSTAVHDVSAASLKEILSSELKVDPSKLKVEQKTD